MLSRRTPNWAGQRRPVFDPSPRRSGRGATLKGRSVPLVFYTAQEEPVYISVERSPGVEPGHERLRETLW